MASRRTYADAVAWVKSSLSPDFRRGRFAVNAFGVFFVAGVALFGLASIASPASFGQKGGRTLSLGWPSAALLGLIAVSIVVLFVNRRYLAWFVSRNLTRPFVLAPDDDRPHEGAVNALAACARPLQLRFALGWSWAPAVAGVVGAFLALSAAYFAIYTVLAGFQVGVETAGVAVANVVVGIVVFLVSAARLATWRLATAVHRAVSPGYL